MAPGVELPLELQVGVAPEHLAVSEATCLLGVLLTFWAEKGPEAGLPG